VILVLLRGKVNDCRCYGAKQEADEEEEDEGCKYFHNRISRGEAITTFQCTDERCSLQTIHDAK